MMYMWSGMPPKHVLCHGLIRGRLDDTKISPLRGLRVVVEVTRMDGSDAWAMWKLPLQWWQQIQSGRVACMGLSEGVDNGGDRRLQWQRGDTATVG